MAEADVCEVIAEGAASPALLLCDHAANSVPQDVGSGDLGLPAADMERHIAYDVGARGVTLELARLMGAAAILSRVSRLVIDLNRSEDDPTLVMRLYDGSIVPANRAVGPDEITRRIARYHRPYHAAISRILDARQEACQPTALVAIHSFTPRLRGRPPRPWHIGVLWCGDDRLARPLIDRLRAEPDLCVGDNQPYAGQLKGDTMDRHGTRRNLPHVLIELRNDLVTTGPDQRAWAARLAPMLTRVIDGLPEGPNG